MQFAALGSFAEMMLVHENACVKIRPDMPLDIACLIGCGVMTGIGAAWNTAQVRPGDTVAVIGCGGIGLNVVQGAYVAGAGRIIAVDRLADKLDLARQFGATDLVDASEGDAVAEVIELTERRGAARLRGHRPAGHGRGRLRHAPHRRHRLRDRHGAADRARVGPRRRLPVREGAPAGR